MATRVFRNIIEQGLLNTIDLTNVTYKVALLKENPTINGDEGTYSDITNEELSDSGTNYTLGGKVINNTSYDSSANDNEFLRGDNVNFDNLNATVGGLVVYVDDADTAKQYLVSYTVLDDAVTVDDVTLTVAWQSGIVFGVQAPTY